MEQRKEIVRLPQIYDCDGRISEKDDWFIEFYVRNPKTDRMQRFKKYKGINKFHTHNERLQAAKERKEYWTGKLKAGWTPFNDGSVIYEDSIGFQTAIKNYRKLKSKNGTFRFYASKYIDFKRAELEPSSISTYTSRLRIFDAWLEGQQLNGTDVSCITNQVMVDFSWHIINNVELSRTTVQNYQNLLKEVFDHVRKERKQFPNPCFELPMTRRVNDSAALPIQEMDIPVFKKKISKEDSQLWMACQFVYYCFLRPRKELRFLKIGDIDFGRSVVRVRSANAKTDITRVVTVPDVFMKELRQVYKLHTFPRDFYVIGKKRLPGPECVSYNNMGNRFADFRKELYMPKEYVMYSWKHTGNGRAALKGIPMRDLQGQNGHTTVQMTEVYIKNINGMRSDKIISEFPPL